MTSREYSTQSTSSLDPQAELQEIIERNDIVKVKWIDAQTTGGAGWQDGEDMVDAMYSSSPYVYTIGYLMHSNDQRIVLCDTIQEDGMAGGYVHLIPTSMVTEMEWLTHGEVTNDETE